MQQLHWFESRRRRGVTAVLFAIMLTVVLAFIALSIDLGYLCTVRSDLQGAVDAGALAGAGSLLEGADVAAANAQRFTDSNLNNGGVSIGKDNNVLIEVGNWNTKLQLFTPGGKPQDAVRVTAKANRTPLFFGRGNGQGDVATEAQAIAAYRPRDIMLVLDVSGSMAEQRNGITKIAELQQAVDVFFGYISQAKGHDRVGFAYYSSTAQLGSGLSLDLPIVQSSLNAILIPKGMTNIADGMKVAREEINRNRRSNSAPLIVLLTDGAANTIQPENTKDIPEAKRRVLEQAELAKQDGIPIFTMALDSLTEEVDVELMQQVAEITGSESYHVLAGETDEFGTRLLTEAFRRVALNRPLRLVD
jgi:Mg-chelatase subunit ChlD